MRVVRTFAALSLLGWVSLVVLQCGPHYQSISVGGADASTTDGSSGGTTSGSSGTSSGAASSSGASSGSADGSSDASSQDGEADATTDATSSADASDATDGSDAAEAGCTPGTVNCTCLAAASCTGQLQCRGNRCLGITKVFTGAFHACAILTDGSLKCWGHNVGELGQGDTVVRGTTVGLMGASLSPVPLEKKVTDGCGGRNFTCALLEDQGVICWGYNGEGQLGQGNTATRGDAPNEVASLAPIDFGTDWQTEEITCGNAHVCARTHAGLVKCWGSNASGQLGIGSTVNRGDNLSAGHTMGNSLPVVDMGGGNTAAQVVAGGNHTCARLETGAVKCWGWNVYGQLGLGNTASQGSAVSNPVSALAPIDLGTNRTALQIAAGYGYTCARLDNNAVKCWGYNGSGMLGIGSATNRGDALNEMGDNLPAIDFGTTSQVVDLAVNFNHACVRFAAGNFKCWGTNGYGQLGLGSGQASLGATPGDVAASVSPSVGTGLTALSVRPGGGVASGTTNYMFTCALLSDQSVKCWGNSAYGQLGNGATADIGDQPNEMGDNLARALVP